MNVHERLYASMLCTCLISKYEKVTSIENYSINLWLTLCYITFRDIRKTEIPLTLFQSFSAPAGKRISKLATAFKDSTQLALDDVKLSVRGKPCAVGRSVRCIVTATNGRRSVLNYCHYSFHVQRILRIIQLPGLSVTPARVATGQNATPASCELVSHIAPFHMSV